jgi:hypothetical protein
MEEAAINILQPVLESAVYLAGHYCKACGRDTVTATDIKYGMRYAARNVLGTRTGTLFPGDEDESDDSDVEVVDDEDEPFTRYTGDDKTFIEMNECFDTWDEWEPDSPVGVLLKNAIDINGGVHNN